MSRLFLNVELTRHHGSKVVAISIIVSCNIKSRRSTTKVMFFCVFLFARVASNELDMGFI